MSTPHQTRADIRARLAEVATPPKPIPGPSTRDTAWGVALGLVLLAFGTTFWEILHSEYPLYTGVMWGIVSLMVILCVWADFPPKEVRPR